LAEWISKGELRRGLTSDSSEGVCPGRLGRHALLLLLLKKTLQEFLRASSSKNVSDKRCESEKRNHRPCSNN